MSADMLRRAASLIRERAHAATPGPWEPYQNIHAETAACEVGRGGFGVVALPATGRSDYGKSNIEHIAAWHPAVALSVADMLDHAAARAETKVRLGGDSTAVWSHEKDALAIARTYLGENVGQAVPEPPEPRLPDPGRGLER